jgi:hypothetical protein
MMQNRRDKVQLTVPSINFFKTPWLDCSYKCCTLWGKIHVSMRIQPYGCVLKEVLRAELFDDVKKVRYVPVTKSKGLVFVAGSIH